MRVGLTLATVAAAVGLSFLPGAATAKVISWTQLNLTGGDVGALAVDPSNTSIVYAGTYKGGVFKSTDAGAHWAPANSGFTPGSYLKIYSLAIDPTSTSTIYAGSAFGHVFRSTDGGGNWSEVSTGLPTHDIEALAVDPSTPSTLYAAPYDGGVYKSTNSGAAWNPVNTGLSASALYVYGLAIDPTATGRIYAATGGGVYITTDGGTGGWTSSSTGLPNNNPDVVRIDPASHTTLYAGTVGGGIYKSTNSGANWGPVNNGIPASFSDKNVRALAGSGQTWYAGTFDGVYATTDGGANWSAANTGLTSSSALALAVNPTSVSTVYAGTGTMGMFKSTDSAGTWTPINTGFTNVDVQGIAVDPANFKQVFVTTPVHVFHSTDGGQTWTESDSGLPSSISGGTLTADPSTAGTFWLGTPSNGLYGTKNYGLSWVNIPGAAGSSGNVRAVTAAEGHIVASSFGSAVAYSQDSGQHWVQFTDDGHGNQFAANGNVTAMGVADQSIGQRLIVAWSDGTVRFMVPNLGWLTLVRTGLPPSFTVNGIATKTLNDKRYTVLATDKGAYAYPSDTNDWFAVGMAPYDMRGLVDPAGSFWTGTNGNGVWENDDLFGSGSWFQLNGGLTNPFISSLAHVPNSDLVYAGSAGGGVYVIGTPPAQPPPVHCVVPAVVGKTLAAAKSAIAHNHCSLGTVTKATSKKKAGTVLSQTPSPGKVRPKGTKVQLVVSKGTRR